MKAVFGLLGLLIVLGVVYGLAFFGIIPVQKMADQSPALASTLITLHLAHAKKPAKLPPPGATPDPQQQALDAQKKQIAADRAQLDKDRTAFEVQKQQASAPASNPTDPQAEDSAAKLTAIYAAMSPDDIARIFAKLPDLDVLQALMQLDEKKAGKILAAVPDARAARLARLMSHPLTANAAPTSPAAHLQTSL